MERASFIQAVYSKKRNRFGIKPFVLCDCATHYILQFFIYTGNACDMDINKKYGYSGSVVINLLSPSSACAFSLDVGYVILWLCVFVCLSVYVWLTSQRGAVSSAVVGIGNCSDGSQHNIPSTLGGTVYQFIFIKIQDGD